ncbi:hypothetical protein [Paludibaculum fermentans]|uniref:hypothetical protein n=1 Tax=Paludibaculum fermentans TaxID=1473598 RepID=UPI003EB836CF
MGEKIVQVLLGLLAAGVLSAIIMLVQKRKNRDAWSGTVSAIERRSADYGDSNTHEFYLVRYIRDDGEILSFECEATSYPFWYKGMQPGDRLVKPAGAGMPQRVPPIG